MLTRRTGAAGRLAIAIVKHGPCAVLWIHVKRMHPFEDILPGHYFVVGLPGFEPGTS
jgi:hypothetical protein